MPTALVTGLTIVILVVLFGHGIVRIIYDDHVAAIQNNATLSQQNKVLTTENMTLKAEPPKIITRIVAPSATLSYTVKPFSPSGENQRILVTITSTIPLHQPYFVIACDAEVIDGNATATGSSGSTGRMPNTAKNVFSFAMTAPDPINSGIPILVVLTGKTVLGVRAVKQMVLEDVVKGAG